MICLCVVVSLFVVSLAGFAICFLVSGVNALFGAFGYCCMLWFWVFGCWLVGCLVDYGCFDFLLLCLYLLVMLIVLIC